MISVLTCVCGSRSVMSDSLQPMDYSPPGSSVYGILQARILEWVPCPPPGDLPDPEIESRCPALQADSLMSVIWLLSHVHLFVTPWTAACQASLSSTISWSLLKLMSIKSGMPSNHLILCHPFLLPSIFPGIRVFSNESALHIRRLKHWSFSFCLWGSNSYVFRIQA